jgi:hypothetical protein
MEVEMEISTKRSDQLIANFVNGYADGWFMKVPECFKRELDIQLTPRVNPDIWGIYLLPAKIALSALSSLVADSALALIKEIEAQTDRIVVWGNKKSSDSFDELVIQAVKLIKDTKNKETIASITSKKSQVWTQGKRYCFAKDHLIHSADYNFSIQVISAIPAELENTNNASSGARIKDGFVKFAIYRLVEGKTIKIGEHTLTQTDFVQLLRNGNQVFDQIPKRTNSFNCQQPVFEW